MKLFDIIKTFRDEESGAVTIDWVVLTAAIVGLGIAVLAAVGGSIEDLAGEIETELETVTVSVNGGQAAGS
ncbi:pilus assembly protein [Actibacterium sp. MT2.3-13A]|uniref:pilus assembly protein n=1 Tax=Actibacterium sp. MT2.3-13A TaxID=2828332 RepID=UPI001BA50F1F|nr:pilus assembly protein [Actibacterium sp. MT2.3-13A]